MTHENDKSRSMVRLASCLALAVFLPGCESDNAPITCADIECPGHSSCDDSLGEAMCICDPGYMGESCGDCMSDYGSVDGECLKSRLVPCTDFPPANATSVVSDVEITYTATDGWTAPAVCEFTCNPDFDLEEGACIDTKTVDCIDVAPDNADSNAVQVEITYSDAGGWSTPADCEWECKPGYTLENGACTGSMCQIICTEISNCTGDDPSSCSTACQQDITDCSPTQLGELQTCIDNNLPFPSCDSIYMDPLVSCLMAIACLDG